MVSRGTGVPRPVRTTEFTVVLGTRSAEHGWRDVLATQRNAVVSAWERLTSDPLSEDLACHALRGALGVVRHSGREWTRRQLELKWGARIWFTVDEAERVVCITDVHTRHPNETK